MKRIAERIAHLAFALVILLGSSGLVLNAHYCSGEMLSRAIFVKAAPCSHANPAAKACPMHGLMKADGADSKKDCCSDKSEYIRSQDTKYSSQQEIQDDWVPVHFQPGTGSVYIQTPVIDPKTIHFLNLKPPLIVSDLPVVLETFRC